MEDAASATCPLPWVGGATWAPPPRLGFPDRRASGPAPLHGGPAARASAAPAPRDVTAALIQRAPSAHAGLPATGAGGGGTGGFDWCGAARRPDCFRRRCWLGPCAPRPTRLDRRLASIPSAAARPAAGRGMRTPPASGCQVSGGLGTHLAWTRELEVGGSVCRIYPLHADQGDRGTCAVWWGFKGEATDPSVRSGALGPAPRWVHELKEGDCTPYGTVCRSVLGGFGGVGRGLMRTLSAPDTHQRPALGWAASLESCAWRSFSVGGGDRAEPVFFFFFFISPAPLSRGF